MNSLRMRRDGAGAARSGGALDAWRRRGERRRAALWAALVAAAAVQFNSGAWAQVGDAGSTVEPAKKDLGRIGAKQNRVQNLTKGARQFKAFTANEVGTDVGQKVDDNTVVRLRNGSTVTMRQALAEVNMLEETLNKEGMSLRDSGARVKVGMLKPDTEKIAKQKAELDKDLIPTSAAGAPKLLAKGKAVRSASELKAIATDVKSVAKTATEYSQSVSQHKEWRKDYGDPDAMSVYIASEMDLKGSSETTEVAAEARAGGSVFGKDFDVLKATGTFKAPRTGTQSVKIDLQLVGKTVFSLEKSYESWSKSQSWSKPVSISGEVVLPVIGPLAAKAAVGVEGTAEIGYEASLSTLYADGRFNASAQVKGFAEVSVSLEIAVAEIDAGFGGNLKFIDADLDVLGRVHVNLASETPALEYEAYAYADLTLLEGELYVFLDVDLPWPLNKYDKRWEFDLVDWDGYKKKAYLFNIPKTSLALTKK